MAEKIVAKFCVTSVERQGHSNRSNGQAKPQTTGVKVNLSPVYDPKGEDSENNKFWEATPNGQLWMQINNPEGFDFFKEGEEVYLTFTKKKV